MNIVFDMVSCGMGNNGGTRTIIKCAQALENIGHKCDIVSPVDKFTWFKHKKPILSVPNDTDIAIATGCTTVASTLSAYVPYRVWYIRGHETWNYDESTLGHLYNQPLINITNSYGLKVKVESFGAEAQVVHQGIDLDEWGGIERRGPKKRIGCLYQKKPTKRWKDFVKLSKILGQEKYEYLGIGETARNDEFLHDYVYNSGSEALRDLYSTCDIWLVPTELEGLHNPPMEAALCGALIVCNDHPMNGICMDYGFDDTAMVYRHRDIEHAAELIRNADWFKVDRMKRFLVNDIGSREKNMEKFIRVVTGDNNDNN